ncbi:DUF697 domain-containing protein [Thiothrix litoralis]|uniref:DUF697 domain-containing protein n=1 Tax=Thiothrix litoralis TaxID=2891210 RepID=A0ABX7WPA4_9GAMM|nr:DUF697 domain-containing protein [Thiothrix litoralis]QTR45454.1 DUF697 domain-containing protein [Thiothrix litoralis]
MNTETITLVDGEAVLSRQQAALLDELTTRLSHMQDELSTKNRAIREQEADRIVNNHVLAGSALGLVPLPLFDLVALSGTQHNMLEQLCQHYGVAFDRHKVRAVLLAVLGGSLPTLALLGMGSAFKFVPGIGTLGGNASLTLLGGAITYAVGQSFIKHFRAGGTLDDVNANKLRSFFRKEFSRGKRFIQQRTRLRLAAVR